MDNLKQRGGRRGEKGKEREGQKGRKRKALPRHSSEQLVDLADGALHDANAAWWHLKSPERDKRRKWQGENGQDAGKMLAAGRGEDEHGFRKEIANQDGQQYTTTLHYTTLRYTTLHYTNYTTLYHATAHNTTAHYNTLH